MACCRLCRGCRRLRGGDSVVGRVGRLSRRLAVHQGRPAGRRGGRTSTTRHGRRCGCRTTGRSPGRSIENEPSGYAGKLPWKGVGWYRKSFKLDRSDGRPRLSRLRRRDGVSEGVRQRQARRRVGLRLHVVPHRRHAVRQSAGRQRRRGARRHDEARHAVVSRRGHLPQGDAGTSPARAYRPSGACTSRRRR